MNIIHFTILLLTLFVSGIHCGRYHKYYKKYGCYAEIGTNYNKDTGGSKYKCCSTKDVPVDLINETGIWGHDKKNGRWCGIKTSCHLNRKGINCCEQESKYCITSSNNKYYREGMQELDTWYGTKSKYSYNYYWDRKTDFECSVRYDCWSFYKSDAFVKYENKNK